MALQVAVPTPTQVTLLQVKIPRYLSWASEDLPALPCPNVTSVPHTNTQCHNLLILFLGSGGQEEGETCPSSGWIGFFGNSH